MLTPKLIREARLRAGLTQAELGARIQRSQSEIARWERGQVTPSLETVRRVVGACGLELTLGIANADDSYAPISIARSRSRQDEALDLYKKVATALRLNAESVPDQRAWQQGGPADASHAGARPAVRVRRTH